jgi:eukaryotic-like serine/threonine-protein kinase
VLGKTLDGKYRIERLLGSGGMGSVYAADDLRTSRRVAIKVLHGHLPESEDLLTRFEREARMAGSVDTEHIARCYETGTDPSTGSPYMVLEYLVGEDLQRALKRLGPLAPDVALRVVAQALEGVSKAHEANIVHRDLKPANIFLAKGENGERTVKVLDFGVAKIRRDPGDMSDSSSTGGLTRTGAILGSPLYMAPEQARSVKNIDHRADLWSLGVVLYQAVAGRTPYEHISGLGDLIIALCSDLPPPVQQFAPWVPPEVAAITDRALRIELRERFQSAAEMLEAVRELLPHGVAVRDDMLTALDDKTHDHIAPTYFRSLSGSGSRRTPTSAPGSRRVSSEPGSESVPALSVNGPRSRVGSSDMVDSLAGTLMSPSTKPISDRGRHSDPRASDAPPALSTPAVSLTGPGVTALSSGLAAPAKSSKMPVLAIAIACGVAGGAGVYLLTRQGPPAPGVAAALSGGGPAAPPPPVVSAIAPPPVLTVAPASSVSATSAASTASAAAPAPSTLVHGGPATIKAGPHAPASATAAPTAAPLDLGPGSFGGRK